MQAQFWSQGLNPYSYVFNDPINHTDPSGFEATGTWLGAGGFTGGVLSLLCYGTQCVSGLAAAGGGAGSGAGGAAAASGIGGGSIAAGLGTGLLNAAMPYLTGTVAGAARPGGTYSIAPTAAPKSNGASPQSMKAKGQNANGPGSAVRRPPSACSVGMCLAQSVPGAEGGPGVERSDGTGGSSPPGSAAPAAVAPVAPLLPALDEAILAFGRALHTIEEVFVVSEAAPAAMIGSVALVPGHSVIVRATPYTDKVGKIAQEAGKHLGRRVTPREINDAIHRVKENLGRGGPIKNPDVLVDPSSGDVRPKVPGGMGDSIGNIFDHLQREINEFKLGQNECEDFSQFAEC